MDVASPTTTTTITTARRLTIRHPTLLLLFDNRDEFKKKKKKNLNATCGTVRPISWAGRLAATPSTRPTDVPKSTWKRRRHRSNSSGSETLRTTWGCFVSSVNSFDPNIYSVLILRVEQQTQPPPPPPTHTPQRCVHCSRVVFPHRERPFAPSRAPNESRPVNAGVKVSVRSSNVVAIQLGAPGTAPG